MLLLAYRSSGLVRFSLQGIMCTPEGVRLSIKGLAKQTAPGRESSLQPVTIAAYRGSQKLCPVECLKAYKKRTKEYRKTPEHQQLSISYEAPHKPVASLTIARRILEASGVSLGEFSAHFCSGYLDCQHNRLWRGQDGHLKTHSLVTTTSLLQRQ